jgi:hypothetical protein
MFISISAIPTFTIPLYPGFTAQLPKSSGKESNKGSMVPIELHVFIDYMKTRNRSGKVPKYADKRSQTWNRLAFLHCSR